MDILRLKAGAVVEFLDWALLEDPSPGPVGECRYVQLQVLEIELSMTIEGLQTSVYPLQTSFFGPCNVA